MKNSRLYPPVPHIVLNQSQDLTYDLSRCFESIRYHLLPTLLSEGNGATAERVLKAIGWFNRANTLHGDDHSAILDLSVAFETLLALPKDAKTDRFKDAVSLLLGRVERFDTWAEQFYDARSDVAHEGETRRPHFAPQKQKGLTDAAPYQSHLIYGRQIFQLCVGAVLFGASLSKEAGIAEKFITNEAGTINLTFADFTATLDCVIVKGGEEFEFLQTDVGGVFQGVMTKESNDD